MEEAQEVHLPTSCAFQIGWQNKHTMLMTASAFCTISLISFLDLNWGGGEIQSDICWFGCHPRCPDWKCLGSTGRCYSHTRSPHMKWENLDVILGGGADGVGHVIQTEPAILVYKEQ